MVLRGRDRELAAIDQLLESAQRGEGGGFVLRGEAGTGKSALLDEARKRSGEMRVLHAAGVHAESALAYATVHQLLRPILSRANELPTPQRDALRIALGLDPGPPPDRFLTSLAVLTLLSDLASERPVLCVVDDAHRADEASLEVIGFVARRLESEPIAVLLSVLSNEASGFDTSGVRVMEVDGLQAEDAAAVLDEQAGGRLAPAVRDALLGAAGGNPLALIELPRMLTPEQQAGYDQLPALLPLADGLERALSRRIDRLSPDTVTVAVLCAAAGSASLATIGDAAARLGVQTPLLEQPGLEEFLRIEGPAIEFRQRLMQSAVYQYASPAQRRAAHLALAEALAGDDEQADRRAWHRAQALLGPDEGVASDLEQSADRTLRRSGYAAAAQSLERAAELSPAKADRVRRLAAAADAAWRGGNALRARRLVTRAQQLGVSEPSVELHIDYLRGAIELRSGSPADSLAILIEAASEAAEVDPGLAARMLALAGEAAFQSGDLESYWQIGPLLERLPGSADASHRLLVQLHRAISPTPRPGDPVDVAAELSAAEQLSDPEVLIRVAGFAFGLGEHAAARRLWTRAVANARTLGAAGLLAAALRALALDELSRGRYAWAEASAAEGRALALETGQPNLAWQHAAVLAEVAGLRGRTSEASELASEALSEAAQRGLTGTVALVRRALGREALAGGRPEQAITHLEALWALNPSSHRAIAFTVIPDLVEGAVRAGRPELAREWVARLPAVEGGAPPQSRAVALRARALVADSEEADALFRQALDAHTAGEQPLERARTELLYGEFLRRERRRVDARSFLRSALSSFERLGAEPWAARASGELRASGETARRRAPDNLDQLTRQELQVVRVVSQGATNREAAAQLFISPRTVDHHLRNVFQKLGISSRAELIRLTLTS